VGITLEVFTDYVCPWCFLSTKRIEKLQQNYDVDVKLAFVGGTAQRMNAIAARQTARHQ